MMQMTTPENPDAIATTADPPAERRFERRRFEAVMNFLDASRVGDCLLALNRRLRLREQRRANVWDILPLVALGHGASWMAHPGMRRRLMLARRRVAQRDSLC